MNSEISQLEPTAVWKVFAGMSDVPRPSKNEEMIREHFHALAKEHSFSSRQDETGNIVIDVPASPGCENAPTIVLQGHLDMVAEQNEGTGHDFDKDPIKLQLVEKNGERFVTADGTTLGADNGIGVSLSMAAAIDDSVKHGPLEILLTTDEEQGMTGADALKSDSFKGRILINLDSEEDDALYIGCAGGCDTTFNWEYPVSEVADAECFQVKVKGLKGGHSGCDIHENRGNAIALAARVLRLASTDCTLQVASIQGGSLRYAIPREATAVVTGSLAALELAAVEVAHNCLSESLENVDIIVEPISAAPCMSIENSNSVIDALVSIPSGVISMHPQISDLVQNSNNLSVLNCEQDGSLLKLEAACLSRSATMACLEVDKAKLAAIGRASGAKTVHSGQYPGWEPKVESALLNNCKKIYSDVFGREPKIAAIHAGLECGIIGDRVGDMDMISFGPNITGAHSPDEDCSVESVARIWKFLKAVLAELGS